MIRALAFLVCLMVGASHSAAQIFRIEKDVFDDLGVTLGAEVNPSVAPGEILWVCDFTNRGSDWVPKRLALVVQRDGAVRTYDPVQTHLGVSPIMGTLYRNTDKILGVRWRLRQVRDKRNKLTHFLDYTLRFNKQRNRASLDVRPFNFINAFNGRGTCERRG